MAGENMFIRPKDRETLRTLAIQVAEIASLPVQKEKIALWKKLNSLKKVRPLVWITEVPWQEMNVNDELTLSTETDFLQSVEMQLRVALYQWRHIKGDMVYEPKFYSWTEFKKFNDFGMTERTESLQGDGLCSRHYIPQIKTMDDILKIHTPDVEVDDIATEQNYEVLCSLFGDILSVEKYGIGCLWFAPWDMLVTWWGVTELFYDLILKPDLVHAAIDRLVSAWIERQEQCKKLNLLSLSNGNFRIGSGGPGFIDELPALGFDGACVRTVDQWGCSTSQIFSEVSPAMHEEFALRYEKKWLNQFGLTYYGCCEPLHNKISLLRTIPNLRKISVSPKADKAKSAEEIGTDYVISLKPNPAVLATNSWDPVKAREILRDELNKTKGCIVEIVMKDISTVRHQPHRLWEWSEIAMDLAEEFA